MPEFFSGISLWSLILLIAGIGFLVAEIFHPGFGLPGVLGTVKVENGAVSVCFAEGSADDWTVLVGDAADHD